MTKIRAATYSRFSSDLQSPTSIRDQEDLCRRIAEREGFEIVKRFSDQAQSGASFLDRQGLMALLTAAKEGQFEVLLIESIDRLTRDQGDLHWLNKQLAFRGVRIFGCHTGFIDGTSLAVQGLLSEHYLEQLREKVLRGHAGVLREGRFPGPPPYGLRVVAGQKGVWEPHPYEAPVVERIYREYIAGVSPRLIVAGLNRDGIAGPRRRHWNHTSLIRSGASGTSILQNRAYTGVFTWGTSTMTRDPDTGKRVHRSVPESKHVTIHKPELRLVSDELFSAAEAVRQQRANHIFGPNGRKRPAFIARSMDSVLSGLLRCACCGSPMVRGPKNRDGSPRVRCSQALRTACSVSTRKPMISAGSSNLCLPSCGSN